MTGIELPIVQWCEPNGNPYLRSLHPMMLSSEGLLEMKEVSLRDERGSRIPQKQWVRVKYDRTYVSAKIINDVLRPLGITQYNDFQKLISGVWKEWIASLSETTEKVKP